MVKVKFNKNFKDLKENRRVKAGEEIEMTLKRADELVKTISKKAPDFKYERTDEPEAETKKETKKEEE